MYLCDECRTLFLYESSLLFSTTRWLVRVCNLSLFLFFLFFVYMKCEPLGSFDFFVKSSCFCVPCPTVDVDVCDVRRLAVAGMVETFGRL